MKKFAACSAGLASVILMTGCVIQPSQYAAKAPEPIPSWGINAAPTDALSRSSVYAPANRKEALAYCLRQMEMLAPSFTLEISYADVTKEISQLAQTMLDGGSAVAMSIENRGYKVTYEPEYCDCVVMLQAHRQPQLRAQLPVKTLAALKVAEQIVGDVMARYSDDYSRAVALHDYIALNTYYESQLGIAAQADATTQLLLEGRAVCDGYAHAYGLLLSLAGIENRFIIGKADGIEHIWNLAKLNGSWVHIDVTYDDPKPDKDGRVMHTYFAMSDARIRSNHSWNTSDFPKATSDSLYYPIRTGRNFRSVRDMLHWAMMQPRRGEWSATLMVQELARYRTEKDVYQLVGSVASKMYGCNLSTLSWDSATPAVLYCTFSD